MARVEETPLMRFMLDANALILLLAGHPRVIARLSQCDDGDVGISAIAFGEVMLGSKLGKPPPPGVVDRVVARFGILPYDEEAARCYSRLPFRRASFDRLIGAHALAADLVLVTADQGNFADMPNLKQEDWTQ